MNNITISNLNFSYSTKKIFDNAQFQIKKETINRIEGMNGVGKTTLFNILSDNIEAQVSITPKQEFEFITNEFMPFNELTGKEIILLFFNVNKRKSKEFEDFINFFQDLNLNFVLKNRYKDMSLGEKQKLKILVSFINKQKIVLLDEPFNALDKESKIFLSQLFKQLVINYNRTIIYISHNDVEKYIDKRFKIYDKKIFEMKVRNE
jgi:ABC-2 type transport system ATP-binding protein